MKNLLGLFMCSVLFVSCGDDDPARVVPAETTTNDINEAYEQLLESAPEITASKIFSHPLSDIVSDKATITALWDNASDTLMGVGSSRTNPIGFVQAMFDATQDQSIFERAKIPFLINCTLDIMGDKTGDLFDLGTQTMSFTAANIAASLTDVCGASADFSFFIDQSLTMEVTNTTDDTYYDQKLTMTAAANAGLFTTNQYIYIRNNDTTLNLLQIEVNADGTSDIAITSLSYDKTNNIGVFQFYDQFDGTSAKVYRIYMNEQTDLSRLFAYKISSGDTVRMSVGSTFASQTAAAISMSWTGQDAPYDTDLADGNACINTTDGTVTTDDTLTCGGDATALASSGATALIAAAGALDIATLATAGAAAGFEDNLPTFTDTTILSAAIGL